MFIERSGDSQAIANAMSANILSQTGRHVSVALKTIELRPEAEETTVFKLNTQMDFFDEKDFRDNLGMEAEEAIAASLLEYNKWLRRFFVAIVKEKDPMIADISYHPGTERTKSLILRSPKQTIGNYLDMEIKINDDVRSVPGWYDISAIMGSFSFTMATKKRPNHLSYSSKDASISSSVSIPRLLRKSFSSK